MKKELLFSITAKDFDWHFYCASGKGGQHRNKVATACRCRHRETGVVAVCKDHREQHRNKIGAFKRVTSDPKFKTWLKLKSSEALLSSEQKKQRELDIQKEVDDLMKPENILYEVQNSQGKWERVDSSIFESDG